jgi:hypothetical protein
LINLKGGFYGSKKNTNGFVSGCISVGIIVFVCSSEVISEELFKRFRDDTLTASSPVDGVEFPGLSRRFFRG